MTTNQVKTPVKLVAILLYVSCLSVLVLLGGWQIMRGSEKKQVEQSLNENRNQFVVVNQAPKNWMELNYKMVEIQGRWLLDKVFLLDNRVFKGKVGFELLHPFQLLGDNTVMLVNRGWLEKNRAVDTTLMKNFERGPIKIKGQLYLPQKGFTLGPALNTENKTWPKTIQYIDREALSKAFKRDLAPAIIVVDSNLINGLMRIWKPYVVDANRHYGYAMQWWGLALVLIIFGFIWSRKHEK